MMFYATFNNISVLLEEETGVPVDSHRLATSHIMMYIVSNTPCLGGIQTHKFSDDRY